MLYHQNISYDEPGCTLGGYGLYLARPAVSEIFSDRMKLPNIRTVFLVTITAGLWLQNPVPAGAIWKYTLPGGFPEGIYVNGGTTSLASQSSQAQCEARVGSYYYDPVTRAVYVNPPARSSVYDAFWQARLIFYMSSCPKDLRGKYWEPRLLSVPNLSLRIEPRFGGIGQIGGGSLTLNNADGYFDQLDGLQWDAGRAVIEMGLDLACGGDGAAMAESDYRTLGTWRIEQTEKTDDKFTLTLAELKTPLENRIPYQLFDRADYPNLPDDMQGRPIPFAWGKHLSIEPVQIDPAAKRFKVAAHPIRSFDGCRIKIEETWTEVAMASVDLTAAEFTLGPEWTGNEPVAVDFSGRTNLDGSLMTNGADIMADLLSYMGESQFDGTSFDTSRRLLRLGTDRYGDEVSLLAPSIYLKDLRAGTEVADELNKILGSYLFVDNWGRWRFCVFNPTRRKDLEAGPLCRTFTEKEIIEGTFKKATDSRDLFSKIKVNFNERKQQDWAESVEKARTPAQFAHGLSPLFGQERDLGVSNVKDADYWAARALVTEAEPLVQYRFTVPWTGYFTMPGEQVRVSYPRHKLDAVLEVLEVGYDLTAAKLQIVAGNRRGWGDTFGWWSEETPIELPAGIALWLKPETIQKNELGRVGCWADASGRASHAMQPLPECQPSVKHNQLPGFPVVHFELAETGSRQYLIAEGLPTAVPPDGEIFIVVKVRENSVLDNELWQWVVADPELPQAYPHKITGHIYERFLTPALKDFGVPPKSLTAWRLYNVSAGLGHLTARLDGAVFFDTTSYSTIACERLILGGLLASGFEGDIAEIIYWPRRLYDDERDWFVVQYLSDKYNLGIVPKAPKFQWNPAWTDEEAAAARQNHGFWAGPSGLACDTDPRSAQAGRWW